MVSSHASRAVKFVTDHIFQCDGGRLFDCWTQPEHLQQWWLSDKCSMEILDNDLRKGGRLLYRHTGLDKRPYISRSLYEHVDRGRKLVLLSSFSNEAGDLILLKNYPYFPRVLYMILDFQQDEAYTRLVIEAMPYEGSVLENANFLKIHLSMQQTFNQKFAALERYINSDRRL